MLRHADHIEYIQAQETTTLVSVGKTNLVFKGNRRRKETIEEYMHKDYACLVETMTNDKHACDCQNKFTSWDCRKIN